MSEVVVPPLAPEAPKSPVSAKVVASTIASIVLPVVLLVLQYLLTPEGQTLYGDLSPILVIVIAGLSTGGATFLSGWLKRDAVREAGVQALPRRALVEDDGPF